MELRRSKKKTDKNPHDIARYYVTKGEDQPGFVCKFINEEIGHGVFTTKPFSKKDFILQYKGDLLTYEEGCQREKSYLPHKGSFLYFFRDKGKAKCIDATESTQTLGRMVNDNHLAPNCKMEITYVEGTPCLCLFAVKDIPINTEIRFDYGVKTLPWRKGKKKQYEDLPSLEQLSFCGLLKDTSEGMTRQDSTNNPVTPEANPNENEDGCRNGMSNPGSQDPFDEPDKTNRVESEVEDNFHDPESPKLPDDSPAIMMHNSERATGATGNEVPNLVPPNTLKTTTAVLHRTAVPKDVSNLGSQTSSEELDKASLVESEVQDNFHNPMSPNLFEIPVIMLPNSGKAAGGELSNLLPPSIMETKAPVLLRSDVPDNLSNACSPNSSDELEKAPWSPNLLDNIHVIVPHNSERVAGNEVPNLVPPSILETTAPVLPSNAVPKDLSNPGTQSSADELDKASLLELKYPDYYIPHSPNPFEDIPVMVPHNSERAAGKEPPNLVNPTILETTAPVLTRSTVPTGLSNQGPQNSSDELDKASLVEHEAPDDYYIPHSPNPFDEIPVIIPKMYQSAVLDKIHNPVARDLDETDESEISESADEDEGPNPVSPKISGIKDYPHTSQTSVTNNLYFPVSTGRIDQTEKPHNTSERAVGKEQNRSVCRNPFKVLRLLNQPGSTVSDEVCKLISANPKGEEKIQRPLLADEDNFSVSSDNTDIDIASIIEQLDEMPAKKWSPRNTRSRKVNQAGSTHSLPGKTCDEGGHINSPNRFIEQEHIVEESDESELDVSSLSDADYEQQDSNESDSDKESTNAEVTQSLAPVQFSNVSTSNINTCDADYGPDNSSESDSDNESTNADVSSTSLSSAQGVRVSTTNNTGDKRTWDKKHYCPFCSYPYAKLPRHLFSQHANEIEVQEVMALGKKSNERKLLLDVLRNKGNHAHNKQVLEEQNGQLITSKRPCYEVPATSYLPCDKCFGYYIGSKMWKHVQSCRMQGDIRKGKRHQSRCALLLPMSRPVEDSFRRILGTMQNDDISLICRNDSLILTFGQKLHAKSTSQSHQFISQKMRELGRFIKDMRTVSGLAISLSECITPEQYDNVVRGVRKCAGYDSTTRSYKIPSLALKLGHSLKRCAEIQRAEAIKAGDKASQEEAERFRELCSLEWAESISTHALKTLYEKKWNKPTILPLTDDVVLLHRHLSSRMADCCQRMCQLPDKLAWLQLAEATLAKIILFNRRRSGETERMYLSDYQKQTVHTNVDIKEGLSKWEQKLCDSLTRVEIRGKRGRKVPIHFTQETKKCVDILVKTRESVCVNKENPYVFALPDVDSTSSLRGHDCLRKQTLQCGAKNPSALTSTKLRKQVATVSQLFCLQKNELDILANFLGHDIMVHRAYYRLPEDTVQMTKVAKILFALEKGKLSSLKGQRLDDVEFALNDDCSSDEGEGSEDDMESQMPPADGEVPVSLREDGGQGTSDKEAEPRVITTSMRKQLEPHGARKGQSPRQKPRIESQRGHKKKDCSSDESEGSEDDMESQMPPADGEVSLGVDGGHGTSYEEAEPTCTTSKREQKHRARKGQAPRKNSRNESQRDHKKKASEKKVRNVWSTKETVAIKRHFKQNITLMRVPRKFECETCQRKEPILASKNWKTIKFKVYSLIQQRQRSTQTGPCQL